MECWATIYTEYIDNIRLDQEAGFTAEGFRNLATAHGIILQFSGAQFHNSIGAGEKYLDPLRRVFTILRERYSKLGLEVVIRYVVKGLNGKMWTEGYVSSMLFCGSMPRFQFLTKTYPENKKE